MKLPTTLIQAPRASATSLSAVTGTPASAAATFGAVLGQVMGGTRQAGGPGTGAPEAMPEAMPEQAAHGAADVAVAANSAAEAEAGNGLPLPGASAVDNGTAVPDATAGQLWAAVHVPAGHESAFQENALQNAASQSLELQGGAAHDDAGALPAGPCAAAAADTGSSAAAGQSADRAGTPAEPALFPDGLQQAAAGAARQEHAATTIPGAVAPVPNGTGTEQPETAASDRPQLPTAQSGAAQPGAAQPSVVRHATAQTGTAQADVGKETSRGGGTQSVEAAAAPSAAAPAALPSAPVPLAPALQQPVAATPPPAPATPAPLAEQLARPLFTLATAPLGEHVITINVVPDSLGPVTVRAHLSADGVRIELMTAGDAGRDGLRSILGDLRRDLAAGGMPSSLSVGSSSTSASGTGTGNGNAGNGTAGGGHAAQDHGSGQRSQYHPGSLFGSGVGTEGHSGRTEPGQAPSALTNNSLDITV